MLKSLIFIFTILSFPLKAYSQNDSSSKLSEETMDREDLDASQMEIKKQNYKNCGWRTKDKALGITAFAGLIPIEGIICVSAFLINNFVMKTLEHYYPLTQLPS